MASWRARQVIPTGSLRGGSVTIQRGLEPEPRGSSAPVWQAVIRCGPAVGDHDVVRLWCGPYNRARGIVQVTRDRNTLRAAEWTRRPDQRGTRLTWRELPTDASEPEGAWAAMVTLPREAFEDDGVLVIGLERETPLAVRTSFPRPMLPGQPEPGRVALNPAAWGALSGDGP